jgi:hypothetical protein
MCTKMQLVFPQSSPAGVRWKREHPTTARGQRPTDAVCDPARARARVTAGDGPPWQ